MFENLSLLENNRTLRKKFMFTLCRVLKKFLGAFKNFSNLSLY